MIYLKNFMLPDLNREEMILNSEKRTVFNNFYPFRIFPNKEFNDISFGSVTIFYGGNGSGKSTLLNIIAEKLKASRKQKFSKGVFFDKYLENCSYEMSFEEPADIKIVTSDDVFDYLFDVRSINTHVNNNREQLFQEYLNYKYNSTSNFINEYDELKKSVDAKKMTMSGYVRSRMSNTNIIEQSNGESALMYFEKEIQENSIYILDEPENSLSAESQIKLLKFIEDSARFFNCQFIISTHSPFLLSLMDAKIYDIDSIPTVQKKWTELGNVRIYYAFFDQHKNEF